MSHANLRIYYTETDQFYLTEDKNAIVDDFEYYLTKFKYIEINGFMYLKIRLDLDIKVTLSQEYSHLKTNPPLHYVRIYEDDEYFYYFIRDYEWISENCVRLVLRMDTLNTVHLGSDYDFGGENIVKRQHFDRWHIDENGDFIRDINIYPEGIEPTLFKTNETVLYDKNLPTQYRDQSFNLVFMNQDDPSSTAKNPVIMLLLGDKPLYFEVSQNEDDWPSTCKGMNGLYISKTTIDNIVTSIQQYTEEIGKVIPSAGNLTTKNYTFNFYLRASSTNKNFGTGYYPNPVDVNYNFSSIPALYVVSSDTRKTNTTSSFSIMPTTVDACNATYYLSFSFYVYYLSDNSIAVSVHCDSSSSSDSTNYSEYEGVFIDTGSNSGVINKKIAFSVYWHYADNTTGSNMVDVRSGIYETSLAAQSSINSIDDIDRTDSRIIKIIKLPYIPIDLSFVDENTFSLPDNWNVAAVTFSPTGKSADEYSINALQAESSIESLSRSLLFVDSDDSDVLSPNHTLKAGDEIYEAIDLLRLDRDLDYDWNVAEYFETKLLFSSFYSEKIVYDSFSLTVQYECIIYEEEKYEDPLTMTYVCSTAANCNILNMIDLKLQYQVEDYSGLFIISRNNDVPLYSNDYLTYLRTGYNYDVKAKNLQIVQNSLNAAGSLASIGSLTNPASVISSAVRGVTNVVTSAIQSEMNLQRTLTEKQYASSSIDGSDDLDLLIAYSNNNKYKLITYEAAPYMKKVLTKLFQLTGYACNLYGPPDMDSRASFNYAECEPDFEYHREIPAEIMEDLENKWRGGVFKVHYHYGDWDLTFDKYNGENIFF